MYFTEESDIEDFEDVDSADYLIWRIQEIFPRLSDAQKARANTHIVNLTNDVPFARRRAAEWLELNATN